MIPHTFSAVFLWIVVGAEPPDDFVLSPPPGPFVERIQEDAPGASGFAAGTPVVATTYFYWYDAATGAHVIDRDGTDALTDHPPTLEGFSYQNVDWHARRRLDPAEGLPVPEVISAAPTRFQGLYIVPKDDGDGPLVLRHVGGRTAWSTTRNRHSRVHRYMYFDADFAFIYDGDDSLELSIQYFDAGPESFALQYDSRDPELDGLEQEFREGGRQKIERTGRWKEVTFVIPHARFADRANQCDFRLACERADLKVSYVSLKRVP